jgi:hypothetical protein
VEYVLKDNCNFLDLVVDAAYTQQACQEADHDRDRLGSEFPTNAAAAPRAPLAMA